MTPKQIKTIHQLIPSLPPLSGTATSLNELIYELAALDIPESVSPRIGDMTEEQTADIVGNILTSMSRALGIRHLPENEDALKMIQFIRFKYCELFPGEIELAFYIILMSSSNEDLKHYGELSIRFLQFVMNRYDAAKRNAIIRMGHANITGKPLEGKPTPQQLQKIEEEALDLVLFKYHIFLSKGDITPADFNNRFVWDKLCKLGLTNLEEEVTKSFNAKAPEVAKQYAVLENSGNFGYYIAKAIEGTGMGELDVIIAYKDLCLREQFIRYKAQGVDLKKLLYGK